MGLWTVGLILQVCLVGWANVLIATNIKDFNAVIGVAVVAISLQVPLTFFIVDVLKTEDLYGDVPETLEHGQVYFVLLLVIFALMLPFMLYRRCMRLIYSEHPF